MPIVGPIYAHYRFKQYQLKGVSEQKADEEWNVVGCRFLLLLIAIFQKSNNNHCRSSLIKQCILCVWILQLHDRYAPIIRRATLNLKGFYLKQAQLMSTQDQFLPPQYLEFCKEMQDRVPTEFEPGQARQIVERELGVPLEQVFASFDEQPLNAASIGQVHAATLLDGTDVVVKIQYPGIERKFRADIATTIRFCRLAMPEHVDALTEIQRNFDREFDYVAEAQAMREVLFIVLSLVCN
jgi:predicted unusual protein kinase regulating ubiquinone biosynthesis (AarF/ABC1/UbiB family)